MKSPLYAGILLFSLLQLQATAQDLSECHQTARAAGLPRTQVERLCQGANGNGPLQCFLRARGLRGLGSNESVQLCRCADSTGPADCVSGALRIPHADLQDALLTCEDPSQKSVAESECMGTNDSFG